MHRSPRFLSRRLNKCEALVADAAQNESATKALAHLSGAQGNLASRLPFSLIEKHEGRTDPEKVNVMSSKLLVSMLALGLAAGGGAAWAQTGGTANQGTGLQSQTGGASQMQSQTSGDESTQPRKRSTEARQPGKQQMGQAGQENGTSGTQTRRPGEMKRGDLGRSGNGQSQGSMQSQSPSKGQSQASTQGLSDNQSTRTARGSETKGQSAATGETSAGKAQESTPSASLTSEQRGRITEVLKKENIRPITNGGFSLSVGTPVPRTVHLHRLPREIVELNPRWRPYEFVLVGNEIVIINPRNFEIVAVMPA